MHSRKMLFATGVFTLIAGLSLAAIVVWFGEFQYLLTPRNIYYLAFKHAPGVAPKVTVRRAGIRIGEVQKVEYDEIQSMVIVTVSIDGENRLREGDEPAIKRSLLGDTFIDIETRFEMRGVADRAIIPPGSVLEGRPPVDPTDALVEAGELVPSANASLNEIRLMAIEWTELGDRLNRITANNEKQINALLVDSSRAAKKLNESLERINRLLDNDNIENAKITLAQLRQASEDLKPLMETAQRTFTQAEQSIRRFDRVSDNLNKATSPLAQRSDTLSKNLDESADQLNRLLVDMRGMLKRFDEGDGTIQRLMRNPSVYQNVDAASALMVKNLQQLNRIFQDLAVFADKIARHPGELGVQGVFSRDTGVKTLTPRTADSHRPGSHQ